MLLPGCCCCHIEGGGYCCCKRVWLLCGSAGPARYPISDTVLRLGPSCFAAAAVCAAVPAAVPAAVVCGASLPGREGCSVASSRDAFFARMRCCLCAAELLIRRRHAAGACWEPKQEVTRITRYAGSNACNTLSWALGRHSDPVRHPLNSDLWWISLHCAPPLLPSTVAPTATTGHPAHRRGNYSVALPSPPGMHPCGTALGPGCSARQCGTLAEPCGTPPPPPSLPHIRRRKGNVNGKNRRTRGEREGGKRTLK